jgi:hypothetical protein
VDDSTCILPVWSAVADPCVLRARVLPAGRGDGRQFDAAAANARCVRSPQGEHIAFDCMGEVARIDLVEGSIGRGAANFRFEIDADERLDCQLLALQRIYARSTPAADTKRLRRQHLALMALDARNAGASWRETADLILGRGDWPGDGDHRKSSVRRLVQAGSFLCRSGPRAVLGGHQRPGGR